MLTDPHYYYYYYYYYYCFYYNYYPVFNTHNDLEQLSAYSTGRVFFSTHAGCTNIKIVMTSHE